MQDTTIVNLPTLTLETLQWLHKEKLKIEFNGDNEGSYDIRVVKDE